MAGGVVIVGGGMVGLALAVTCRHALTDVAVTVLEARPLPTGTPDPLDSRASALNHASRSILTGLGIWTDLEPQAGIIRQIHVSNQARFGSSLIDGTDIATDTLGYVVENHIIGRALKARADALGVVIDAPCEVAGLLREGQTPAVLLRSGQRRDADLVVIADGSQSELRRQLGIDAEWRRTGQCAVVANVSFEGSQAGIAFERFTPNGPLALLPLPTTTPGEQRFNLVWSMAGDAAATHAAMDDADFLAQLQSAFGWRLGRACRVGRRNTWPLDRVAVRELSRPGFLVAGNAAHGIHPVAGQGLNLSLRDAASLGASLKQARLTGALLGSETTLTDYTRRVSADQRRIIDATDMLSTLFRRRGPLLDWPRDVLLTGLDAMGPLRRDIARRGTGLDALNTPAWGGLFEPSNEVPSP